MAEANDLHPSPELLSDFALGKLEDDQLAAVACHLSDCATCRETAAATTDSLLDLLRPDPLAPANDSSDVQDTLSLPFPLRHHCRYRFIRELGRGGMGSVYLAEHRMMKQFRAIKIITPSQSGNPRAVERFKREIALLSKLCHPAIVQGFDGEDAGGLYLLVMEYIEGESLAQVLERRGPLPIGTACEYARQVAFGLQYAHEQGLVHRDIKPANLMLTTAGQVKILDFGLARLTSESQPEASLTQEHAAMGTPDYVAPEQALDARNADICADIYALGCTLFCLLTGKPPFGKPSALAVSVAHLQEPPPSLSELRPDAPAELCDLVHRMLAKLPGQRPQTPEEVAACLTPFVSPEAAGVPEPVSGLPAVPLREEEHPRAPGDRLPSAGSDPRIAVWRKRRVRLAVVGAGVLAAVALIIWAAAGFRERTQDQTSGTEEPPHPGLPGKSVQLSPDGFIPLFNGKDLAGWRSWQGEARGWKVEDGALVCRGEWSILYNERGDFEDFHLRVEALVEDGVRSGIRFRCPFTPHDPDAYEVVLNGTAQELQRTGSLSGLAPVGQRLHAAAEWFTLEVIARGHNIVTRVNGRRAATFLGPAFKKGRIALMGNCTRGCVKYRKIEIKPLSPARAPFAREARGEFVPLFNGKDLKGWAAASGGDGGWIVEDGCLVARGPVKELYTDYGYFENFHLRAEARINDGGYAIVGWRAYRNVHRAGAPQAYCLILNATGLSTQRTGSLADLAPFSTVLHRPDEWITVEVVARGDHLLLKVNGKTTVDHHEPRFRMGHIFLGQETPKSEVWFRGIEIKELTPPGENP